MHPLVGRALCLQKLVAHFWIFDSNWMCLGNFFSSANQFYYNLGILECSQMVSMITHCRWVSKFWIYLSFIRLLPNRDLPHLTREFFNKGRLISGSLCGTFNFTWKKIICYHSSPMDSHRNSLFVLFSSKNELLFAL